MKIFVCLSLWLPSLRAAVGGMLQVRVVCTLHRCLNHVFGGERKAFELLSFLSFSMLGAECLGQGRFLVTYPIPFRMMMKDSGDYMECVGAFCGLKP